MYKRTSVSWTEEVLLMNEEVEVLFNAENRQELAKAVVECWDMDTLISYARSTLENHYVKQENSFYDDWHNEFE